MEQTPDLVGRIHSLESMGTVDGPGIRFVAFLQGCPMRCLFCHNPDTWDLRAKVQYELTPEQLMAEVRKYKAFIRNGGVTLSGGEPLMQPEFVEQFFRLCRAERIHTALDTAGGIFNEATQRALDAADLVLFDVKTVDDELHKSYIGVPRTNNARTLDYLLEKRKPIWLRHVVVPGITDRDERLHALGQYLQPYAPIIERVELLAYHTMGIHKYQVLGLEYPLQGVENLTADRKQNAKDILAQYLNVKIQ